MDSTCAPAAQFEYVDSVARFLEIEGEWNDLELRSGAHIFQNHRFLRSWMETVGRQAKVRLAIVLYRENGILQAIFPGCIVKRMAVPNLTWLGGFNIDYGDIVFDSSTSLPLTDFIDSAFMLFKRRSGLCACFLDNVREDALIYEYLRAHFVPYRNGVAPYVRLDGSFAQYCDSLKVFRKKMKSDTQRQIRRLSALGALEFRICGMDDRSLDKVVRTFIEQKKARLQDQGKRGVIQEPGYVDLFMTEATRNPHVHLSYLSLNNDIIAIHFGYMFESRRMYYYMPSFAEEYSTYSPSRVLVYNLLEHCFQQEIEVFDLTIGGESYKYDWTRDEVATTSFIRDDPFTRLNRYLLPLRDPKSLAGKVRARISRG